MTTTAAVREGSQLAVPSLMLGEDESTVSGVMRVVGQVESMIRTATTWRTELIEVARRMVALDPGSMLAPELAPDTWSGDDAVDMARRALVAEVATTLTVHERTAARLLDEAEVLVNGLPTTTGAMRAGQVSYRHAQALVEHTADLDPGDRRQVETATLPAVTNMAPGAFERHAARARERLLAEPVTRRHERAAARRSVRVDPARDGMVLLTAHLPAATACAVMDRLDRAVDVLRGPDEARTADHLRADVLSALLLDDGTLDLVALSLQAPGGAWTPAQAADRTRADAGDGGSRGTARHDAASATAPAGGRGRGRGGAGDDPGSPPGLPELWDRLERAPFEPDDSPRRVEATRAAMARIARSIVPHVTVTVPVLTLLRALAEGDPPDTTDPDDHTSPPGSTDQTPASSPPLALPLPGSSSPRPAVEVARSEVAYLDGYGPIDDHTATLLAARAPSLRRLLTHPHTGAVLAMGRDTYTVPADLRAYLRLRDATCRFPGCTRPATRCDTDHTVAYVAGGTTDATNLAHLCRTHHRLKHATAWTVRHTGTDATLVWTSPTGREHTTHPAVDILTTDAPLTGDALENGSPPPF